MIEMLNISASIPLKINLTFGVFTDNYGRIYFKKDSYSGTVLASHINTGNPNDWESVKTKTISNFETGQRIYITAEIWDTHGGDSGMYCYCNTLKKKPTLSCTNGYGFWWSGNRYITSYRNGVHYQIRGYIDVPLRYY